MSPEQITEALHEKAEATVVGPVPLERMATNVRQRRRGIQAVVAASLAVAVIAGIGLVGLARGDDDIGERTPSLDSASQIVNPPPGYRFVGLGDIEVGDVVIVVPETWTISSSRCGQETGNTVTVLREDGPCVADYFPPPGTSAVEITRSSLTREMQRNWRAFNIDGVRAVLGNQGIGSYWTANFTTEIASVYVPSQQVLFEIRASARPESQEGVPPLSVKDLIADIQIVQPREPTDRPDADAAEPVAPDGMRFVGIKNVVVAVPESWGIERTNCGQPTQDTVYFGGGRELQCLVPQGGISSVLLLDLDSEYGAEVAESATTKSQINGLDVRLGPPVCLTGIPCAFDRVVVMPEQRVVLATPFLSKESGVLGTVQLLPDGYTTVPHLSDGSSSPDALEDLAASDLNGQLASGADCCPHYVIGSDPAAGSVVPIGSEVTVLVGDG